MLFRVCFIPYFFVQMYLMYEKYGMCEVLDVWVSSYFPMPHQSPRRLQAARRWASCSGAVALSWPHLGKPRRGVRLSRHLLTPWNGWILDVHVVFLYIILCQMSMPLNIPVILSHMGWFGTSGHGAGDVPSCVCLPVPDWFFD